MTCPIAMRKNLLTRTNLQDALMNKNKFQNKTCRFFTILPGVGPTHTSRREPRARASGRMVWRTEQYLVIPGEEGSGVPRRL